MHPAVVCHYLLDVGLPLVRVGLPQDKVVGECHSVVHHSALEVGLREGGILLPQSQQGKVVGEGWHSALEGGLPEGRIVPQSLLGKVVPVREFHLITCHFPPVFEGGILGNILGSR